DTRPQFRVVADASEFRTIAGFGFLRPIDDVLEYRKLSRRKQPFGELALELQPAKVVVSPFQICCSKRTVQDGFEQRNVFIEDLVLKRLGTSRNEYPASVHQSREQICESLAGPRTGFDDDVILLIQRPINRFRHPDL